MDLKGTDSMRAPSVPAWFVTTLGLGRPGFLIFVALLVGCSRYGSGPLPQAAAGDSAVRSAPKASIRFVIKIPKRHRRGSHYISPATRSISIEVYDATHTTLQSTTVGNLVTGSLACVPAYGGEECTVSVPATPGHHTLDLTTYDQTGATGHALSGFVDFPTIVLAGKANSIPLTLGGLAASFNIVPSSAQATFSTATGLSIVGTKPQQFTIAALDADGDTIVGAGAPTPVVDATPTSTTLLAPQPASPTVWTLTSTYTTGTNPTIPGVEAISVTATPVPGSGGATLHATIPLKLYDPWIYVVDSTARTLFAFDESGQSKAVGGVFLGINVPYDATYVPTTNRVYVSDEAVSVMRTYDVLGTAETPGASTPFPNLSAPYQSAFDSHDGLLYVPNYGNNTITAYDAQGNQQTVPSFNLGGSFLNEPDAIACDPNNGFLYIANYGANTAAAYNEQGIQETDQTTTFKNLSSPAGLAFDSHNSFIYVANSALANHAITAYSENGAQQTLGGGFGGAAYSGGIAYDPYDGILYVTNSLSASVTAYDEQGNQQTLGAGAFSGLSHPWGIFIVP